MSDVADATRELRLVADPTRAHILRSILSAPDGRVLVGRLAEELRLRQPTVSHHVKVLLDEGLLQHEPEGRRTWYSLAPEHADRIAEVLGGPDTSVAVEPILDRVVQDLSERFQGVFSPETVERYVRESYELLAARPTPGQRLPSLSAQFAADRLDALARDDTGAPADVPEVLFVCVQNAGRSQMASAVRLRTPGSRGAPGLR